MSGKNEGASDNVANLPTEFRFDESPVRTVMKDGEPWFIAKDVCDILDIANPRDAIAEFDDDEKGVVTTDTPGGPQTLNAVNESGLYMLIFASRKSEAKRFRKWVTREVLPEIRKTGGYSRPEPEFEALSGEYVNYKHWLLERALLDAKLIAISMQAIGVHYARMATDDPESGAERAEAYLADYDREIRANVHRSREFIRRTQPGSFSNRDQQSADSSSRPSAKTQH